MIQINPHSKIIFPDLSYRICGICFNVHNKLGRYRNEKQYSDALENELKNNKIQFQREYYIPESFDGENKVRNKIDFLIEDKIILEIKANRIITKNDYYQLKRYLVSGRKKLGLLVNFRNQYLHPKRILN